MRLRLTTRKEQQPVAHMTVNIHLRERDIGAIKASDPLETGHPTVLIGDEVCIFVGRGDEAALVLAAIRKACEDALAMLPKPKIVPQPGAGAEFGMEAERG